MPDVLGKKVLECVTCSRLFSLEDVLNGLYQLQTLVCSYCYARMQALPYEKSCFGKPMAVAGGRRLYGYDPDARECREECPDRELCRQVFLDE